jgi:hypothetical protein
LRRPRFHEGEKQGFFNRLPGTQRFVWTQVNKNGWLEKSNREHEETFVLALNLATRVIE